MDLWDFIYDESSNSYVANDGDYSDIKTYSGDINENGEIEGKIPQYIYNLEKGEFIPVTDISALFLGITELKISPKIPDSITDMRNTFSGCRRLIEAPEIPNGVEDIQGAFYNCTSLIKAPEIPDSATYMFNTFNGCTSLTEAPKIPNSVYSISGTFAGCTNLIKAPEIPNGVIDMNSTFKGCTNLTGNLVINADISFNDYQSCLTDAAMNEGCNLILSGTSPQLQEIYDTRSEGSHITCPQLDNVE